MPQRLEPNDSSGIGLPSDFPYFCCWKWCILVCWVCRLSLLAAQALLPSHQVGNQFPRVFEWPNAWLLMTFDGKWTCQPRIYYDMLWSSSLRTSASRFWRQVTSAGAVLLTIWVIFQIWNHDIFTSRYRLANEFTTVKLHLESICWWKIFRLKNPTCQIGWARFCQVILRMRGLVHYQVVECNDLWSLEKMWGWTADRSCFLTFQISVLNCRFCRIWLQKTRNVNFHTLSDMIIVFNVFRYFTSLELLRLHGFPENFNFPETVTEHQRWDLSSAVASYAFIFNPDG